MKPIAALTWHFGGLACVLIGAFVLWSWPAVLIVIGLWGMLGTVADAAMTVARSK